MHEEPDGATPSEGDASICWTCYGVALFTGDGGLRALEGEELDEVRRRPLVRAALGVIRESYEPSDVIRMLRRDR